MSENPSKLKITIDSEKFRADLQALADEIKADMAKSLDTQVRMIVREEMSKHLPAMMRDFNQSIRR